MKVARDIPTLQSFLSRRRAGDPVVLVPTMGALHDGHRACVEVGRTAAGDRGQLAVSIFVNPAQFGPGEDLDAYPREEARDLELCRSWASDLVFLPSVSDMYPCVQQVWVDVEGLTAELCGRSRPGHFRGVATVVAKLFNVVQPDVAVFGQKDAQQALVIREMVRGLNMPVELRLAPIARESDGLARSSRNQYLDAGERSRAAALFSALTHGRSVVEAGERDPRALEDETRAALVAGGVDDIEYVEARKAHDLSALDRIGGRVILAIGAHLGDTRLIDNVVLEVEQDRVIEANLF